MSDNEDLLGDDLGDHSLADYNLGNDEEDQLLADDYEGGSTQNVPSSIESFREPVDMVPSDYSGHGMEYGPPPMPYQPVMEAECVVPNIIVEVPNLPPAHSTYAPYEPRHYESEHSVPPAMPAAPIESPQIVPSEIVSSIPNDMSRERFISERPVGAQRMPQIRDIPDTLDKVVISNDRFGAARRSWRNPQFNARFPHPYRRNNAHRGNFGQRNSFPPPQSGPPPPSMPQMRLEIRQERPMEIPRPLYQPPMEMPRPPMDMPRPPMEMPRPPMDMSRPPMDMSRPRYQLPRFPYREERPPMINHMRPQFERTMYYPRQQFQRFGPPLPHVTIRQNLPEKKEPEIRMLPVQLPGNLSGNLPSNLSGNLPANLPTNLPGGLAGKKVLINPHFKGNFQPPVEGPKDIDDAAERFIAEQRNALARAAARNFARRSPQRYIENTTIEIENELARRGEENDLLRRQEEFIHANRAGLRRRMRSPSPPPLSPLSPLPPPPPLPPRRSPSPPSRRELERDRRPRPSSDEDNEYKRRVREQESMRERVLRAKEVRRRKNAALHIKQMQEREKTDRDIPHSQSREPPRSSDKPIDKTYDRTIDRPIERPIDKPSVEEIKPDTTRKTPEREWTPEFDKERSPVKKDDEVNSTCEDRTPPPPSRPPPPPASATPASDDELELILGDIDGILSEDDDDILNEKPKITKPEPPKPKPLADLRSKLPPKSQEAKKPRQKIIFADEREEKKRDKSPPRKPVVSSTKLDDSEVIEKKPAKKLKQEMSSHKSRQRIIFENKDLAKFEKEKPDKSDKAPSFPNRRVILHRKPTKESKSVFSRIEITNDPSKPNPGIFSRAVRTIGERDRTERDSRIVLKEPEIEYDSSSDDEDKLLNEEVGNVAMVDNLPHGMTDTRLKTLAGDVQSLILDKEKRCAKIYFKTTSAAENFKKKFNNKMVAASRLTVKLQ